ncbi:hypothetical protein [Emticicia sp. 17c]|uniref:hypothetical protein n=1 Tax=Emticicia sp. 17c TaxID=3127704 RepID=UPI00301C4B36
MKIHLALLIFLVTLVTGCTTFKVSTRDSKTGYFKKTLKAPIIEAKENIDLDSLKSLVVVDNNEFLIGMTKNLNFFEETMNLEGLERKIIAQNLQNEIPTVNSLIGLSNASKKFKPFLYLSLVALQRDRKYYAQLKLFYPQTGEYLFVSEAPYLYPSDQSVFYPLFNSLIDFLQAHSSYK